MPLFSKAKMSALSPAGPPQGFGKASNKQPKKKKDTSKPIKSGFLASFGKK